MPRRTWHLGLILITVQALAGCQPDADPQPRLQTYGVVNPICVVLCDATVHTVNTEDIEQAQGSAITATGGTTGNTTDLGKAP